jgi:hypothetical protein
MALANTICVENLAPPSVLAMVVESRLTPEQHVQDFEQSPTYP